MKRKNGFVRIDQTEAVRHVKRFIRNMKRGRTNSTAVTQVGTVNSETTNGDVAETPSALTALPNKSAE